MTTDNDDFATEFADQIVRDGDKGGDQGKGDEGNGGGSPPAPEKKEMPAPPASEGTPNLKEIFGESFDTLDKVKAKWEENNASLTELGGLREIKTKYEDLVKQPQVEFADPTIAEFNSFAKATKIKDFSLYQKVKAHDPKIDPIDTIVLKEILENPALSGKEELIKKDLIKQFNLDTEKNTVEEIELGNFKAQQVAQKAAEYINGLKEELGKVPKTAAKPDPEEMKKLWSPVIAEELAGVDAIPIPIKRGDKVEKLMDYALTPELKQQYNEQLSTMFMQMGAVTPESRAQVKKIFSNMFYINNAAEINHAAETKLRTSIELEYDQKYAGYKTDKPPGGNAPTQDNDDFYAELAKG